MKRVLSTKKLSLSQKELLLNAGLGFVEYDAITIEFIPFQTGGLIEHAIFTSKNAVKAVLAKNITVQKAYCVGSKTEAFLKENDITVLAVAENATKLAQQLVSEYKDTHFVFFCGSKRRSELPETLKKYQMVFREVHVYNTLLNPKSFETNFDGILFFSPSGVESFTLENDLKKSAAFCIGNTTAEAIKQYTDKYIIASKPTVENVIVQAVKHLSTNEQQLLQ